MLALLTFLYLFLPIFLLSSFVVQYLAPENTMEGFAACCDMGCDSIEFDVFLLKDGELIVYHGQGPDNNPGGMHTFFSDVAEDADISNCTYSELNALTFDKNCPELSHFAGTPEGEALLRNAKVPKLRDVLEYLKKHKTLAKIELKGRTAEGCADSTIPTLELVKELDMFDQVAFSSFVHSRLAVIRGLYPEIDVTTGKYRVRTGALFEGSDVPLDYIEQCKNMGANEIHLQYDAMNIERVEQIREAGMKSMAWLRGPVTMRTEDWSDAGNEDETMFRIISKTGVDEICCNRPDIMTSMRKRDRDDDYALSLLSGLSIPVSQALMLPQIVEDMILEEMIEESNNIFDPPPAAE
jgi:glycerophosphoryl diester phosphodiesterase